jgi:hypothetical protein
MKSRIAVGFVTLFLSLFFLQPVFAHDLYYRSASPAAFVAQVRIGGDGYYRARWDDREYYSRHGCRKDRGWRHRHYEDRYYDRHYHY